MLRQKGFSLIELLIVVAIILIIVAIAIPNLLRARMSANEAAAINNLRSIATAQITYKTFYPATGYASDLTKLGAPSGGGPTENAADLLPNTLTKAPFQHSGYIFTSTGDLGSFSASAEPKNPGSSGVRSFCTDTPAAIFFSATETGCAPGTSPPITN